MRVALVVPVFPRLSETFVVAQFQGLLDRGVDAHVVCMRAGPAEEWKRFPALAGADVRRRVHPMVPARSARGVARATARVAAALVRRPGALGPPTRGAARRILFDSALAALAPDLVHFEFGALAVGRTRLASRIGARLVVSFRGYDIDYVGLDRPGYYREVWEAADGLHFLGEDLWRRALARGCPPDTPRATIPPAVDATRFDPGPEPPPEPRGTDERPLRILGVGRLAWKKGHEFGLEAVRRLEDRGIRCRYAVVGDGPRFEALAFARHQLGLEERVELAGALAPEAVIRRLAEADVFLHPAVSEGFCNAVLEAQAMGRPVVCTDADGLSENVVDGETGFVVARRDPDALAGALARLAGDPRLRARMGAAGRARVVERFRPEAQAAAFERLYREAMA